MKFAATKGRLIIKPGDKKEKAGSIFIPENAQEDPQIAVVVSAGPGCDILEGSTIIYPKYQGTEVTIDGQEYLILLEETVLAVMQNE